MKQKTFYLLLPLVAFLALTACGQDQKDKTAKMEAIQNKNFPEAKPDSYWKKVLSPEAYEIMVNKGTETPYDNPYWNNHKKGVYVSAATGKPLFSSRTKFESGTGWPSFYAPINEDDIMIVKDNSFGMERDEVVERSTGLHLGHVFDDGPAPTGKRFCMNSYALKFIPAK